MGLEDRITLIKLIQFLVRTTEKKLNMDRAQIRMYFKFYFIIYFLFIHIFFLI